MLDIGNLSISYRRVPAVSDVSLQVTEGEFIALIGPNGAGKTTTLKSVFGLVKPQAGQVTWRGKSLLGRPPEMIARLGLALVPEGRHIFTTLTVRENLLLGYASGRGSRDSLLDEMLTRFPVLRRYYKEPAGGLSGGEQQQLAIARALLSKPQLLVLDEPSLGLAPLVVDEVFALLAGLREQGATVLLVEQNAARALAAADRAYVLSGGRVVAAGTAGELSQRQDIQEAYLGKAAAP
jgi:branched-chain amino acid transport system ATP-binding protein